jgi:hypothetical protein
MKVISKLFSVGWMASEITLLIWIYNYVMEVGLLGAVQGFLLHTFLLWIAFAALMALKRHAETHAWPLWSVKLLRVLFVFGYGYDCWFNTRYGTLAFAELPPVRENVIMGITIKHRFEPFTSRLQRHYPISGWRGNEARIFCALIHLIDKRHCLL